MSGPTSASEEIEETSPASAFEEIEETGPANAFEEIEETDLMKYLPLYKAAIDGDWTVAERIISSDPSALSAKVSTAGQTVLHVAVSIGASNEFVSKLVDKMPEDLLGLGDSGGKTPLHYAATTGNTQAMKILVKKNKTLPQKGSNEDNIKPLHYAAMFSHRESVRYLLQVTTDEDPSPFAGALGVKLLNDLITAEIFDIALDLIKRYPKLAVGKDSANRTILWSLAFKSKAYPSGSNMGYFQRLIYQFVMGGAQKRENAHQGEDVENPSEVLPEDYKKESKHYGCIRPLYDTCLMHKQVMQILRLVISQVIKTCTYEEACSSIYFPIKVAMSLGVYEFVAEILMAFPPAARLGDPVNNRVLLHLAVFHRQEKIYNLLSQTRFSKNMALLLRDKHSNNLLHLAGMLNPSSKISGAAMQMQRELQWFKEVEKVVPPKYTEMKNSNGKTPRMVFSEEHKTLVGEGEKWMKSTAESCALVAALIVTIAFAAAFTAPGGLDNDGIPNLIRETPFLIFAVSDTLALFSSATSLLMFLGILTSRYAEEDFLFALPMRLCIGLISLFLSIASMLVAFTSSMHILVVDRVRKSWVPIGALALVPVCLFAILQFPLLVQIVYSTFGPSIFQKPKEK